MIARNAHMQHKATAMQYSARQLAGILGVQPSTITRDIKKSRLCASRDERGGYVIDASEIVRAYPGKVTVDDSGNVAAKRETQSEATAIATDATTLLEAKLEAAERLLADREQTIDDLRRRLDAEGEERRRVTAILTDQRRPDPAPIAPVKPAEGRLSRAWKILRGQG